MKKSLVFISFFFILLFNGMEAIAQNKYKVEYQIEVFFRNGSAFNYNFRLANFTGDTSGPNIFSGSVTVGQIETSANFRDAIISTPNTYSGVNRQKNSVSVFYDFCNLPTGLDILSDGDSFAQYFNVYEILPFSSVNGYSAATNTLSECESSSLRVHSNSCGSATYAVQFQVGGSSVWNTLLAYGRRSSSFSFQQSDFPGLDNYENLRLRVQHNNTGTIEFSDVLTYSYIPCSPALQSTAPVNVACFDSNNGGVQLTFDRPLDSGEQFRATLSGVTPEGFTIPEADAIANTFGAGNTYDWANNLDAGNYTLTYQTFLLNGPGSEDDAPTSTGETGTFTISRPSAVTVSTTNIVQPVCVGDTGSVTLTAGGGQDLESGTYQYSNNNGAWQASPTFNNLAQGSNNVFRSRLVLSGGRFCVSPTPSSVVGINTITNGISITAASVNTPPSYPGATDGAITINSSGGSANRTFQVNGPVTRSVTNSLNTAVISNLPAGTYSIIVSDGNGCTANFASTVVLNAVPVPTIGIPNITIPISCFGNSNGSITIPISGGVASYNFDWRLNGTSIETGTIGTSFVRSNLAAGNYSLIVSSSGAPLNVAAATDTRSITLNAPTQLVINSAVANDISCFGGNDGSIAVNLGGGTAPYRYRISNSGGFTNSGGGSFSIPVVSTGTYPLFIRDANDCEVVYSGAPLTVGEPTAAVSVNEIVARHVDNTVNGGNTGILEISVANNVGTQSVVWTRNGAAFTPSAASTNLRLVDLTAGSYQVTFTDTNGCTASLPAPIVITEPGPLGITSLISNNPILCRGDSTGSITATVTGTPDFDFVWERQGDPGFMAPNQATINGLQAGTYTLRLTDSSTAPEVSDTITITEPALNLTGTANQTNVSCTSGNDGTIVINAAGGTSPYQYSIDNGNTYQTSNTFNNLSAANYTIIVQDANGCTFTSSALTIDEPTPIVVTSDSQTNVSSSGGNDGSLAISIAGGTAPYSISWSGPNSFASNLEDIATLTAGIYTLEIRDANHTNDASGCFYRETFEVTEPGPLAIDAINVVDVDCKGNTTGSISVTTTGNAPLVYVWEVNGNVIPGETTNILQNIGAAVYTLTVSDNSANTPISQNITVNEPLDALSATAVVTEVTCFGGNDGIMEINAFGGTPPYQYALDGGTFQTTNSFGGLIEGNYRAVVRDSQGCLFDIPGNIFVNAPQQMGLIVNEQRSLTAANSDDGAIRITPFGGTSPYTYQWTADNGFVSSEKDITDLASGNYTVTITDSNFAIASGAGCSYTQNFFIAEPGVLVATIAQSVFLECKDDAFAELMVTAQGGVQQTPPDQLYNYEWFEIVGGSNSLLAETTETIADLAAGEYFVRVTDANGISVDANPFTVTEPELLQITLESKTDILCFGDATGEIDISVSGGTTPYRYFWDGVAANQDLSSIPSGIYNVEVVDENGCTDQLEVIINEPTNPLEIPNFLVTDASEYEATDGAIDITIAGGLAPYTITWTRDSDAFNVSANEDIAGLSADSYTVLIIDANGCMVTQTYQVDQPDIVEETITPLSCNGGSDASITVEVNRGNGTFGYSWSNGATTNTITNLSAGTYSVTITGFGNGDLVREFVIEDPEPIVVNLGTDALLCAGQTLILDATLSDPTVSYSWTSDNGFTATSPIVELSEKGTYTLTVVNDNGCSANGSINIDTSEEVLDAILAVSSQGFTNEKFIAVDITYPFPDVVEWIMPLEANIITQDKDQVEFTFEEPGEYAIGMFVQRGECSDVIYENILVLRKDASVTEDGRNSSDSIKDFILFPNPTSGQFSANVELSSRGNISIKIFSFANNRLVAEKQERGSENYLIDFDISNMPTGVYAVMLETPFGKQLQKIIVR